MPMWSTRASGIVLASLVLAGGAAGCGGAGEATTTELSAVERATRRHEAVVASEARRTARATAAKRREIARLREEIDLVEEAREADAAQAGREVQPVSAPAGAGSSAAGGALFSVADRRSFAALERTLGGASGVAASAVGTGRPVSRVGSFQSAIAWSTSKVPVAMAAIAAGTAQDGPLTQAITASDNASAETLWSGLGGGTRAASAATSQLRAAGDATTRIQASVLRSGYTAFGQTRWALADQARFTAGMPCSDAGQQVLGLMSRTIPSQRWGLGSTRWSASLKGGWGPGSAPGQGGGYIDRQMGILTSGGRGMAVTIMARPASGTHEAGTAALTRIAAWVVAHVDRRRLGSEPSC